MNILWIVLAVVLIWRIRASVKKGAVRELISLVNFIFAGFVIGLLSIIWGAYHTSDYLKMIVLLLIVLVLSAVYSLLKIVFFSAKVITKLPLVSSADKLLGVLMGVAETFIVFWTACCVCMYGETGAIGEWFMQMIGKSQILYGMYQCNLLALLLDMIKAKSYGVTNIMKF